MEIDFGEVMHKFYAGRQYGVMGPRYEDINWFETDEPKPTVEHLASLWETIKDEVAIKRVHQLRSTPGQYPALDQLVVALWEKVVEGKSETANALQQRRLEIKAKYPHA